MASIKGYQVKAFKTFAGHEGEPLRQGNLYFGNKKVGFLSEDFRGGGAVIDIDREHVAKWEETAEAYLAEHPEERLFSAQEFLFYSLLELTGDEATFKKAVKKGYKVLSLVKVQESYFDNENGVERLRESGLVHTIQSTSVKDAEAYAKKEIKSPFIQTNFTSLEDFIIA